MTASKARQPTPTAALAEAAVLLRDAQSVLVMCHINPDGDAIGSLLGLAWVLRALPAPPTVVTACADPTPPALQFLPGTQQIHTNAPPDRWDVIVALDASDPARLGDIFKPEAYNAPVIVLDHHVTNHHFGTLNVVDTNAAATAQIVLALADALEVPIGYEAAVCLLTGLVTDTLSFRTNNMTPAVFTAAARLMAAGADVSEIAQRSLFDRPLTVLRLWGAGLSQAQFDGQVAWIMLSRAMRERAGLTGSSENGLSSQLINAAETKIAAVFNEIEDQQVEISLRSRPGYDVATVALRLGGGGHPQAAGCTLPGSLAEVAERVRPLLAAVAEAKKSS